MKPDKLLEINSRFVIDDMVKNTAVKKTIDKKRQS